MFSEFLSFCLMGVSSNLEVFLSEKHLNDHMVRPTMEIHDEEHEDQEREVRTKQQLVQEREHEQHEDHQEQQSNDDIVAVLPSVPLGLRLEIPTYKEVERDREDSNDGFKTPTSPEHKIPTILRCPPAPKKPKPTPSMKRKGFRPRVVLDLSEEIESLFPTPCAVDLGAGGKNKKVKLFTDLQ